MELQQQKIQNRFEQHRLIESLARARIVAPSLVIALSNKKCAFVRNASLLELDHLEIKIKARIAYPQHNL